MENVRKSYFIDGWDGNGSAYPYRTDHYSLFITIYCPCPAPETKIWEGTVNEYQFISFFWAKAIFYFRFAEWA